MHVLPRLSVCGRPFIIIKKVQELTDIQERKQTSILYTAKTGNQQNDGQR